MVVTEKINFKDSDTRNHDVTFRNAKFEKIHRWFPYLEGFAEKFIEDIIEGLDTKPTTIYEPFAGSGTLPVYSITQGIDVYYSEVNPFLQNLIKIKLDLLKTPKSKKRKISNDIDKLILQIQNLYVFEKNQELLSNYKGVFLNCVYFNEKNFDLILRYKTLVLEQTNPILKEILNVGACEALLHSSFLKRAGDIRYKKVNEYHQISNFDERVVKNLLKIKDDLLDLEDITSNSKCIFTENAKIEDKKFHNKIDLVITSPPYLNGTNYIRNTKLELWFLGYLKEKKDLNYYRNLVVTAGINDVGNIKKEISLPIIEDLLSNPNIWYDKRIPKMINDYFFDMDLTFKNMNLYLKKGGLAYIDIGDSIYGGIHIKTDEILIELLIRNQFKLRDNILLRQRKSKNGDLVKQTLIVVEKI